MSDVDDVNSGAAWADKYGDLHYIKKGDKIVVSFDESDAPISPPKPDPCTLCIDGKIHPSKGKAYPCECALGDKWAKDTGYMGPATDIKKGPVSLKGYYDKKFIQTLTTNTVMTYQDYTKVFIPPQTESNSVIYTGQLESFPEPEQEPPNVRVVEELKGRKFKKL